MYDIDVVYVWCGSPSTKYCGLKKDLMFSVFSVRKNMPWIRHIWVVVHDDFKHVSLFPKNVKIVKESEIVPKKFLPVTWNSNVIETWVWRIKNLSERFIYMCDDMYIGKPTTPDAFFFNNTPILRVCEGSPDYPPLSRINTTIPYVRMWANAVEKYNMHYTRIQHQVLPYRKSLMQKFYKQYKKEVDTACRNKIRSGEKDFNLLRFSSSLSVMSGDSLLLVTNDDYDYFTESDDLKRIERILKVRPQFFCINNTSIQNQNVVDMLEKYFNAS